MKSIIILVTLSIIIYACLQQGGATMAKPSALKFFDLKGYFYKEAQRLSANNRMVKTVTVNGQSETKVIGNFNYKKELAFFADADINRPAWSDKYVVDTVFNDAREMLRLDYKSKDDWKDVKIKTIGVDFNKNTVSKVYIVSHASNSLTNSHQVLTYQPDIGYSIENHQKTSIEGEQDFKVEVKF